MIVVRKALYKNFTNFKSKLSNYKGIFKNGIRICKYNREKKLIAVKKIIVDIIPIYIIIAMIFSVFIFYCRTIDSV